MAVSLATVPGPADGASKKRKKQVKPPRSLTVTDRADPSVARVPGGYVVLSTGAKAPRATSADGRHFSDAGAALLRRPAWAKAGDMWASDLASYGGRWLLFFSASVPGMKASSHCIGVAQASSATGTFVPIDDRPLVCPPGNGVPAAEDQFVDIAAPAAVTPTPGATESPVPLPPNPANAHGAIDPSFTIVGGRPYLLYKTDGRPSSLRVVQLTADGLHVAGRSRQLLRSAGVVENPVLTRHGRYWYLITSEGDYGGCGYRTVWRRSLNALRSWQAPKPHVLLSLEQQRLCGPGGADILTTGKRQVLYFHAWTCQGNRKPCSAPLHAYRSTEAARRPVRALYGLRLGFTKRGYPRIDEWLKLSSR